MLKLEFALPENLLTKLAVGAKVRVTTAAYPGRDFTGVVDFIEPAIDAATPADSPRIIQTGSIRSTDMATCVEDSATGTSSATTSQAVRRRPASSRACR